MRFLPWQNIDQTSFLCFLTVLVIRYMVVTDLELGFSVMNHVLAEIGDVATLAQIRIPVT